MGDIYGPLLEPTLWSGILGRLAPGAKASAVFTDRFKKSDGEILDIMNVPLSNPDFAPFLQRARSDR